MADNHNHQWKPCRCSYAGCTRGSCGTCYAVLLPAEEHIAGLGMMCDTARHEHNPEYREFHRSICLECNRLAQPRITFAETAPLLETSSD